MSVEMGEIFLARQQYIGFKIETNAGTAETLADANFNVLAENLKIKVMIKENQRKYAVGDPYAFQSVMGAQSAEISFSVHVQGSGSTSVDPYHFTLLQAAGFTIPTATTLFRAAVLQLPNKTATMEVQQKENAATSIRGKKYKVKGAAATKCVEHYDGAGQLQRIDFTFLGALVSVTDLGAGGNNVPVLTADLTVPPAVLAITSKFGSLTLPTNAVTIDYGLKGALVEYPPDATGYSYTVISDLDPIVNLKVLIQLEATLGVYAALTSATPTLAQFQTTVGTGTDELEIFIPNAQIVKGLDLEARDGIDEQPLMLRAIRNTTAVNGFTVPLLARMMPIT